MPSASPAALVLRFAALSSVIAAAALGGAPGAWAQQPPTRTTASAASPDAGGDAPTVVTVPAARVADAVAYWTPQRMAEADRAAADRAGTDPSAPGGESASIAAGDALGASLAASPVSRAVRVAPVAHVGRLYMRNETTFQTCSANAVASTDGLIVATAAHCIDDFGLLHQRMVFVPAYESGRQPYGAWPVTAYAIASGWTGSYSPGSDTAFLQVASPTGRSLTATVGASPVEFDRPADLETTVYGYPGLPPFDREHPFLCRGKAVPDAADGRRGVPCTMNEGASGGPWFDGADADAPQYGVTTNRSIDSTRVYAPSWGPLIEAAYRAIEAR